MWLLKDLSSYYFFTLTSLLTTLSYQSFTQLTLKTPTQARHAPQPEAALGLGAQDLKYLYYRWLQKTTSPVHSFPASDNTHYVGLVKACFASSTTLNLTTNSPFVGEEISFNHNTLCLVSLPRRKVVPSGLFSHSNDRWAPSQVAVRNRLSTSIGGLFYQTHLNLASYKTLTAVPANLVNLNTSLALHDKSLKSLRFLYNYSTLHRSFLQGTHRLTHVKRLLFGSFFDQRLFTKNIWASNTFELMQNTNPFLKSELDLLYGEALQSKTNPTFFGEAKKLNQTRRLLDQVTFYEDSFFWTFKRFYLTLSLPKQVIQLFYTPAREALTGQVVANTPAIFELRSEVLTNFFFQPISTRLHSCSYTTLDERASSKDVQLTSYDRELLTIDDELILLDLLLNPTTTAATLRPYSILNASNLLTTPLERKTTRGTMFYPSTKLFTEQPLLSEVILLGQ